LFQKIFIIFTIQSLSATGSEDDLNPESHKKSLEKLKKIDPDFYNFLEENDENLLNFGTDSEEDASDKEDDDDEDTVHQPGPLTGDSDESDFEVWFILIKSLMLSTHFNPERAAYQIFLRDSHVLPESRYNM
jgi:hypothetical protein